MPKNNPNSQLKDLVIIGGGPAGISAGIYACLDSTNFVLLEKNKPCSFMENSINSHYFVNGFTGSNEYLSGTDLKKDFLRHYKKLGGKVVPEKVIMLSKKNDLFYIQTNKKKYLSKSVILATGTRPKTLDLVNANKYEGSIHYDCVADGAQYKNRGVIVVGGRNAGAVAACYLHDIGCKVTLIEIKDKIQAKQKYHDWLSKKKIKCYVSSEILELAGDTVLEKALLKIDSITKTINVTGIFVYIGRYPDISFCDLKLKKMINT